MLERWMELGIFRVSGIIDVSEFYIFPSEQIRLYIILGGGTGRDIRSRQAVCKDLPGALSGRRPELIPRPGYSCFYTENRADFLYELEIDITQITLSTAFLHNSPKAGSYILKNGALA